MAIKASNTSSFAIAANNGLFSHFLELIHKDINVFNIHVLIVKHPSPTMISLNLWENIFAKSDGVVDNNRH